MAQLSQREQLALHEFSMRMRQAAADRSAKDPVNMDAIKEAVREQHYMEQDAKIEPPAEPQTPAKDQQAEPPEPEL